MIPVPAEVVRSTRSAAVEMPKKTNGQTTLRERLSGHHYIRRALGCLLGNFGLGVGICLFKTVAWGNEAYSGLNLAIQAFLSVKYTVVLLTMNIILFLVQLLRGRKLIGFGTFVNWFLIGPVVDLLNGPIHSVFYSNEIWVKVLVLLLSVGITSLSCSLYQVSDMGISPYDSLSLMMDRDLPLPYFWCRIITDVSCVIGCIAFGGKPGIGTVICAFGLGPFITFFDRFVSRPLMKVPAKPGKAAK